MKAKKIQKKEMPGETIAAIATPVGAGGIAVVRISGPGAFDAAAAVLEERNGRRLNTSLQTDRFMRLVRLRAGKVRDNALCVFFFAPHSVTGEDVAEIHTHGNPEIAEAAVRAAIAAGARQAEAGEFTRRAFLNGKIDLTAAEGIADLIGAQGEAQLSAAYAQSEGALYREIDGLYGELTALAAQTEAAIDYPEEDIEEVTREAVTDALKRAEEQLTAHLSGYDGGSMVRDGVRVALIGEANVGKSMLMNALLRYNRVLVTATAGTTRDTVEESFQIDGYKFVLCDTAGIRETADEIENMGIERSRRAMESADLILAVTEYGKPFSLSLPAGKNAIVVFNKCDLAAEKPENKEEAAENGVVLSALTGENLEELRQKMAETVRKKNAGGGARLNNARQYQAALRAKEHVVRAERACGTLTMDCVASDITAAAAELGKITGRTASEDIINEIFTRFCVGK